VSLLSLGSIISPLVQPADVSLSTSLCATVSKHAEKDFVIFDHHALLSLWNDSSFCAKDCAVAYFMTDFRHATGTVTRE